MATAINVLEMLIPDGGWTIIDSDFASIKYDEGVNPITEKQFSNGFAEYDAWKANRDAEAATHKAAILNKIGITADEAKILLS